MLIRTAEDFDRIPLADFPKFFPAEVKNGKTWLSLFLVSEMAVGKLKRTAVGFYQYSAKKVWIQESSSFTWTNVRKISFFIRKDPRKANRDLFAKELFITLSALPLNAEISATSPRQSDSAWNRFDKHNLHQRHHCSVQPSTHRLPQQSLHQPL